MIYRLIAPSWAENQVNSKVLEGEFSDAQIKVFNRKGYNVYYLPNYPKNYDSNLTITGSHVDCFNVVFVDCDLKDGVYSSKEEFIGVIASAGIQPSRVVDSGNGVHVYWNISDLDAKSYLRFQRRLLRLFRTDEAVGQLFQLMRAPGTLNTKDQNNLKPCEILFEDINVSYTCEELDKLLPQITKEDEDYCVQHYNKTHGVDQTYLTVDPAIPYKFGVLLRENKEAKLLWTDNSGDRSKADYRLGHIMFASNFTKEEAMSVLVNTAKAITRAPIHRHSYAENIVKAIWTFELEPIKKNTLSQSVTDILSRSDDEALKGTRFACQEYFDGTEYGFRLGQVMGLVAGVGVGKTAIALNIFKGFVERNPDYIHMFVSLEMPTRSIALRWKKMCQDNNSLHSKVHVLSNYNDDGTYRNLSLSDIQTYIIEFQKEQGVKVGCVCIDHIGILKQQNMAGEYQGLREICSQLKSFAIATETMFIIQSQTNRDKAGIGDLELSKDAAYGTQSFESYLDFLMVCWQPLKRCYDSPECPRVTAYKFAKIREKSKDDAIIEDQCYRLSFDYDTELLRPMTQDEETSFDFFAKQALNKRKLDRKTDLVSYKSTPKVGT